MTPDWTQVMRDIKTELGVKDWTQMNETKSEITRTQVEERLLPLYKIKMCSKEGEGISKIGKASVEDEGWRIAVPEEMHHKSRTYRHKITVEDSKSSLQEELFKDISYYLKMEEDAESYDLTFLAALRYLAHKIKKEHRCNTTVLDEKFMETITCWMRKKAHMNTESTD